MGQVLGCLLGARMLSEYLDAQRVPGDLQGFGVPARYWGCLQGTRMPAGCWKCLLGAEVPTGYWNAHQVPGCPLGIPTGCQGVHRVLEMPVRCWDTRKVPGMPGGCRAPAKYQGCPGGAGDAGGCQVPGGYRGCPGGTGDALGMPGARRVPGCPAGGGGGGGVPGLRRGSGATWWAAASRSRAGSGRASPGPAGGRENGTGLLERRSSSFARQPQRLQTGSARRSGQLLARRQESSGLPSALPCSSSLADPADILLLLLLPRGTRVPVPPPASCSEELVPSEKAVRVELAARFPGNGCRPSRRDRLGVYHHRAGSLAGIAVSRAHQGTEILASDAAYGNLSSRLGERSKSPKAGGARGKPLPCERSP
ncbi:elastin-like [Accipiter gentilis]|uniref:elastin-like n=1 Tax=Astur gentilis TaxID=8957 RepID=UPI00210F850B|nr:elastin-like [Accipiter gentilis]